MDLLLSTKPYQAKPTEEEVGKMRFHEVNLDVLDFVEKIKEGYSFTAMMKDNWRSMVNFEFTELLVYDIDHSDVPMDVYLQNLTIKPTVSYTSPSNTEGDYRYRLVYLLDKPILDVNSYYRYNRSFEDQMSLTHVDPRSYEVEHYWNGSYNCSTAISDTVLSLDDIVVNEGYTRPSCKSASQTSIGEVGHISLSCTFIKDFYKMRRVDFIEKYKNEFVNLEHTPLDYYDDTPMVKFPDNYYEVWRPWQTVNGETKKIADGEGRRKTLYENGVTRRKIKPDLSFENLLYNLTWEFEYYYINNGNVIDKKTLFSIAKRVMKEDIYESNLGKPRYKSFVNTKFCAKYGLTKKQAMGKVNNKKQYIGDFYDASLSDNENIKVMNENGLDVKKRTLQTWKKENGLSRPYKKKT